MSDRGGQIERGDGPSAPRAIRIVLDSRLENVVLAGRAVASLAAWAGLPEPDASKIELCVVEAANNAIRHSYGLRGDATVEVSLSLAAGRLEIVVGDQGTPMPGGLPREPFGFDPDDIASLPEGGMGLYIIRTVMDELRYESAGGRNRLVMSKDVRRRPV